MLGEFLFLFFFKTPFFFIWDNLCVSEQNRERECRRGGPGEEGEGEADFLAEQEAWYGTQSHNPGIMTWTEGAGLTDLATQPLLFLVFEADRGQYNMVF